jgi:hypothetical protein
VDNDNGQIVPPKHPLAPPAAAAGEGQQLVTGYILCLGDMGVLGDGGRLMPGLAYGGRIRELPWLGAAQWVANTLKRKRLFSEPPSGWVQTWILLSPAAVRASTNQSRA